MSTSRLQSPWCLLALLCLGAAVLAASDPPPQSAATAREASEKPVADDSAPSDTDEPTSTPEESDEDTRTELNLLGQVDVAGGESRRNENVRIQLIDNNVLKELNQRVGTTATIVREFEAERRYFGGELGGSTTSPVHVAPSTTQGIHGNLFWGHNNSILSARSFFQVGRVRPARENNYGAALTIPVWRGAIFSVDASRDEIRGNVNGNILVPRPDERTPLATDPQKREFIERILAAYPKELPNRTDINERALNTNAPQRIDNNNLGARLQQNISARDRLIMRHRFRTQKVEAFQLVGGQNPNTTTRSHDARITWNRVW